MLYCIMKKPDCKENVIKDFTGNIKVLFYWPPRTEQLQLTIIYFFKMIDNNVQFNSICTSKTEFNISKCSKNE